MKNISRRALGRFAALAVPAATVTLAPEADAQQPRPAANPATGNIFRAAAAQLAQVKLPRTTEPVTRFEA